MFDPINGPAHTGALPSTNDSTENGDTWHAAVVKMNSMFKSIFSKLETPFEHIVTAIDEDARKAVLALEEEVAMLKKKIEAMSTLPVVQPAQIGTQAVIAGAVGVAAVSTALGLPSA